MFKNFAQNMVKAAGDMVGLKYDAALPTRSRRPFVTSTLSEDKELRPHDRQAIISQGRDLLRNFALAGFMVRKHLQYVASFAFEATCRAEPGASEERKREIDAFNELFEEKIRVWQQRRNCDLAQRHCFSELLELIETHRVFDGDVGVLKVGGGRIQIIEGDRIRNPVDPAWQNTTMLWPDYEWVHGVKVGRTGRAFRYAINRRLPEGGFEFEREVPAENLFLTGYYTRIDQIRGVAKLAPVIEIFAHLHEGIGYALAKAKLGQLLGIFSTHKEDDFEDGDKNASGMSTVNEITEALIDKFGPEIAHIAAKTGDTVEMVNANTPSNEFQAFCVMVIRLIFAALDIPYSFFDGDAANYYGQKGELDNYVDSCKLKQTDLIELLDELTEWLVREWVADGELELPEGMTLEDVRFEWTGAGLPWWRLIDDAKGYLSAFLCGLASPVAVGKSYKTNVWKNLQDIHDVLGEAKRLDVSLAYGARDGVNTNIGA